MKNKTKVIGLVALLIFCSGRLTHGADATAPGSATNAAAPGSGAGAEEIKKPAWLTDLSLGVKEGYDDNVYLSGVNEAGDPSPKNLGSWVTTFSPKIGVDAAPLLGKPEALQALALSYAPDFVLYHDQGTESYDAHRFAGALRGKEGDLSYNLDDSFVYVHGSKQGPAYPDGLNAWSSIALKDRREQLQDRGKVALQYDWGSWFVRPTASLLYFDMRTDLKNPSLASTPEGYQNYEDRNDVNGGADVGYKILPQIAATIGYRYGHQYQQAFSWDTNESSSDYQRVLAGIEGQPWKWLKVQLQGGPDFRNYDVDAPVENRHLTTYYGEALVAATFTPADTLTFKYKQWQFVSACGRVPYFDSSYDLSYLHKFNEHWAVDAGARVVGADYTSGDLGTTYERNDYDYILAAGVHYSFNQHFGADLGYSADFGRNEQDNIANAWERDFDRNIVSLAAQMKF